MALDPPTHFQLFCLDVWNLFNRPTSLTISRGKVKTDLFASCFSTQQIRHNAACKMTTDNEQGIDYGGKLV